MKKVIFEFSTLSINKNCLVGEMDRKQAIALLKEVGLPDPIIRHSIAVAHKAMQIAQRIAQRIPVDIPTVEVGALLHDIGRVKSQGIHHAAEGSKLLREHGLPEAIVRIAEIHSLNAMRPQTIEEKIVCYTDKIVKGTHEISVNDRFDLWMKRYGKSDLLVIAKKTILKIEKELAGLLAD